MGIQGRVLWRKGGTCGPSLLLLRITGWGRSHWCFMLCLLGWLHAQEGVQCALLRHGRRAVQGLRAEQRRHTVAGPLHAAAL